MKQQDVISVLDIGTFKTCVLIANISNQQFDIIGIGYCATQGVKSGIISDIHLAEQSILTALSMAENMASLRIKDIYVNVSGKNVKSNLIKAEEEIDGQLVAEADISELLYNDQLFYQKAGVKSKDYEIIHRIPIDYKIDDLEVENPIGMIANVLSANVHVVFATKIQLDNVRECVLRCGINVIGFISSACASGFACEITGSKNINKIYIDFGAGTTSIIFFAQGVCCGFKTIPIGSINITQDIAYGLGTNLANSERIKVLHGSANVNIGDDREIIMVPLLEDDNVVTLQQVAKNNLNKIIEPRVDEILEMLKCAIAESEFSMSFANEITITGAASILTCLRECVATKLNKKVKIKKIEQLELKELEYGGEYSCAIGMIKYLIYYYNYSLYNINQDSDDTENFFSKIVKWIKKNL